MRFRRFSKYPLVTAALVTMSMLTAACGQSAVQLDADIDPATASTTAAASSGSPAATEITSADPLDDIVAGSVVDGEPVQPRTATSGFKKTTIIAPAPAAGTASFSYTAGTNVDTTTTMEIEGGCPDGWYVRPAQPDYYTQTSPEAAYSYSDPDSWIFHVASDDGVSGTVTPNPHNGNLFNRLEVSFYNSSMISKHHAAITFWCDFVPSWYSSESVDRPNSATPTATTTGSQSPVGDGPVPSQCYYCQFNTQIINFGTGLALDPSTASPGSALIVNSVDGHSDQNWYMMGDTGGSVFKDGLATFGLWQFATVLSTAVGMSGTTPTWASASAAPPAGGQFYYVDRAAGQVNGTAQFISVETGLCLASPATAGQNATMIACDTTDATQWWYMKGPM